MKEGRGGEDRKKKLETKEPFQDSESLLAAKTAMANLTNFFRHSKITTDHANNSFIKFVYSEKTRKFCEICTSLLSTVDTDKSKMEISQNFVAFSEYRMRRHHKALLIRNCS